VFVYKKKKKKRMGIGGLPLIEILGGLQVCRGPASLEFLNLNNILIIFYYRSNLDLWMKTNDPMNNLRASNSLRIQGDLIPLFKQFFLN
jgi:hypothetical protein